MANRELQERVRRIFDPLVLLMLRLHVSPAVLTAAGLVLSAASAVAIWKGKPALAAVLLLLGGICDTLDGAIARATKSATKFGAFIDSTIDRYSEVVVFLALAWRFRDSVTLVGVVLAITGSLLVSYTRARAEGLGEECKVGLLERPERLVLLIIGLFAGWRVTEIVIWVIAILAHVTAVQRMLHVARRTRGVAL
jgi:CDP-diacylglycerol--glycerol-3-phosphate 3-phosphatidyltransferase